jgi:hypothetical protein
MKEGEEEKGNRASNGISIIFFKKNCKFLAGCLP